MVGTAAGSSLVSLLNPNAASSLEGARGGPVSVTNDRARWNLEERFPGDAGLCGRLLSLPKRGFRITDLEC